MRRRVIAGMGANSFGMAITIGIQLASLPLFLYYWDTATYGQWLVISAIPAYLSMADVGMVAAAGNKMAMAMGRGEQAQANCVFQSAQLFMVVVCGAIALVAIPLVLFAPLPGLASSDIRYALAALCVSTLLALGGGLSEAVFKATQRYATGTMLGNFIRIAEWLGMILGLALIGTFTAVAVGGLLCRAAGLAYGSWMAQRGGHGMHWGVASASRQELRTIVAPAVSFMAFPLANALSFQGVTLLVAAQFGPSSVALFNTYRTLSRIAVQATAIFSHALWPEFSRLFGQGDMAHLHQTYRRAFWINLVQAVLLSVVIYLLAPWLLQLWTHGAIGFESTLMFWMLAYAAIGGSWHVSRILLMGTNQHAPLAGWSIAAGALTIALCWLLGTRYDIDGVALGMLISELAIAILCVRLATRLFNAPTLRAANP